MTAARQALGRRSLLALLAAPAIARAQVPQRPVTLVAPFTPGGPVDVLARLLAQGLQAQTGQPATVENRTGGAGNIGIDAVRRAAPDGTTLLVIPAGNLTINPTIMRNLTWELERDLAPVTMLATAPNVVCCAPGFAARDVAGLIALAKARPGGVTYGSPGVGSQLHLAMELLAAKAGVEFTHVPYRGTTQALSDLLGGPVQLLASNLPVALEPVRQGQIRALAMTTARRSAFLPEVPTLAESGFAGMDVTSWYGLLAPRATPPAVVEALHAACEAILREPATAERVRAQALDVVCEAPAIFAARLRRETAEWAQVIRDRNIAAN